MKAQKQKRKEVIKTATKYKWVKKYPQYMYSGSIVKAEEKLMRVLHTKYGYKKSHSSSRERALTPNHQFYLQDYNHHPSSIKVV